MKARKEHKKHKYIVSASCVCLLLFVFLPFPGFATQQSASLQGIVVRTGTTDPLSKVDVVLRVDGNNPVPLDTMTTDSDGRFIFPNVRPGRYQIAVTRSGYWRAPLGITVAPGQQVPEVRLSMTPTGAIEGRVYKDNGEAFGNVEVQALKVSYQDGRRVLTVVQAAQTNDLGEYRLFWLTPGRYYIGVVHPEAQSMLRRMMTSSGSTGMTIGGIDTFFSANSTGDPALEVYRDEDEDPKRPRYVPIYFPGTADEQSATAIDLRAGADFAGANIAVAPVRARMVRGFVVDGTTGKASENARVRLVEDGPIVNYDGIEVDSNTGSFEVALLPGSHTLVGTSGVGIGYASVQIRDADIENVKIVAMPPFDITGRISVEGGNVNAADLETLRLSVRRDPAIPGISPSSYSHPLANGSFTLSAGPGDYGVNVAPILSPSVGPMAGPPGLTLPKSLEGAYIKSIRLGNADVLNSGLHLERPPEIPLEIVIGTNTGALEGTVVNDRGQAAVDAAVVLVPEVRLRTDLFEATTSDASGRFRFDRLPPGDYKLFGWQEVENGAWFDPDFMRAVESRGQAVRVVEGTTEKAQIRVIPAQ
jgi:5-hydroxyisourate hydrolase-like protein (transthyretin family)